MRRALTRVFGPGISRPFAGAGHCDHPLHTAAIPRPYPHAFETGIVAPGTGPREPLPTPRRPFTPDPRRRGNAFARRSALSTERCSRRRVSFHRAFAPGNTTNRERCVYPKRGTAAGRVVTSGAGAECGNRSRREGTGDPADRTGILMRIGGGRAARTTQVRSRGRDQPEPAALLKSPGRAPVSVRVLCGVLIRSFRGAS